MPDTPEYAVGRGKPPLHSRFKKGQSGNPSGKPGPAKLAKLCFRQVIHQALGRGKRSVQFAEPKTSIEWIANRLVFDAACGKVTSTRLLLSLLDDEIADTEILASDADETDCEQHATETQPTVNATE